MHENCVYSSRKLEITRKLEFFNVSKRVRKRPVA